MSRWGKARRDVSQSIPDHIDTYRARSEFLELRTHARRLTDENERLRHRLAGCLGRKSLGRGAASTSLGRSPRRPQRRAAASADIERMHADKLDEIREARETKATCDEMVAEIERERADLAALRELEANPNPKRGPELKAALEKVLATQVGAAGARPRPAGRRSTRGCA